MLRFPSSCHAIPFQRLWGQTLAQGSPVRLPTPLTSSSIPQEGRTASGRGGPGGPTLATETMVLQCCSFKSGKRLEASHQARPSNSGSSVPSTARDVPLDCLEVERQALAQQGYPTNILGTLLKSKKTSTSKVYGRTWKRFRTWCLDKGIHPLKCTPINVLAFLQEGLEKGLSTSTLKRQVSALKVP